MALNKIVYGVRTPISPRICAVHGVFDHLPKSQKTVAAQSEIGDLGRLQLKLELVSNQRNEFRIRGFSLGIGNRVPKEPLKRIQITSIPGDFDGVADGPLHSGRRGLEGLGHLGVEYLGDSVRVPVGPRRGFQKKKIECIIHEPRHQLSIGLLK